VRGWHSYSLAEVLTKLLFEDHGERVHEFIAEARAKDAGEAAAKKHFGITLGALAGSFLGPGNWERQIPNAPPGTTATTPPSSEPQPGSAGPQQDPAPNSFQKEAGILMELIRGKQLNEARAIWEKHVASAESVEAKAKILDVVACIPLQYDCEQFLGEALDLCSRALAFSPESSTLFVTRIGLLTRGGRWEEVLAQAATLAKEKLTNRDRAVSQYYLALAEHNLGNTVDAEKTLQEAIELGPLLGLRAECELTIRGNQELME
jgi:tetratricopeptide (TPR) repeat protein